VPFCIGGGERCNSSAAQRFSKIASREMFNNDLLLGLLLLVSYTFSKVLDWGSNPDPGPLGICLISTPIPHFYDDIYDFIYHICSQIVKGNGLRDKHFFKSLQNKIVLSVCLMSILSSKISELVYVIEARKIFMFNFHFNKPEC
jgi:hypothetical protein